VPQDARWLLVIMAIAYLLGSIPTGLLIARARGVDIRKHGSGNIGATNVWRVMGWRVGLTCFALDMLKGFVPSLIASAFATRGFSAWPPPTLRDLDAAMLNLGPLVVGGAAMIGHVFPVWLKFKGGKGVATGFGALLGVWPVVTVAMVGALTIWAVTTRVTRMVGVSSVVAAFMTPVLVVVAPTIARWLRLFPPQSVHRGRNAAGFDDGVLVWPYVLLTAALALVVVIRHRGNIARSLKGTEPKIGLRPLRVGRAGRVGRLFRSKTPVT
jgi:glycerol-3-phosphate acyltransferase PlsY